MNPIIKNMTQHVSVRDFKNETLSQETKDELLLAAQSGSTSNFVQAFSIIEITDKTLRNELADITVSSPHVKKADTFYVFVADLHRQATILEKHHQNLDSLKNMESLFVSTIDTTIAAENMAIAAESMGLGICFVGSIRNNIQQVADLLQLPELTVPLFGMTIGVPGIKNAPKPRMPKKNYVSKNAYDADSFNDLSKYDATIKEYYANRETRKQDATWSDKNLDFFKEIHRPDVAEFVKNQGFTLE